MKIYVAGNDLIRARSMMDTLKECGHVITYDWAEVIKTGPSKEKAIAEAQAVRDCDLLIFLWADNQESARYEAGMAMGLEKPVVVSGKSDAFFFQLPNVHPVASDDLIPEKVQELSEK